MEMHETNLPGELGTEQALEGGSESGVPIGVLYDVSLQVTVELGRVSLPLKEVLRLGKGSVLDLARHTSDPVDILANGKLIARGEPVVVDSMLAVRLTELISGPE